MEKNLPKYNSYSNAMRRVNAAIAAGYFLEAITIEESILADRLLRVCRHYGYKPSYDRSTLGMQLTFIKKHVIGQRDAPQLTFLDDLEAFWEDRNRCLHEVAKSEPGAATPEFEDILKLAERTAIAGKQLLKKVGNWAAKYKATILKASHHTNRT